MTEWWSIRDPKARAIAKEQFYRDHEWIVTAIHPNGVAEVTNGFGHVAYRSYRGAIFGFPPEEAMRRAAWCFAQGPMLHWPENVVYSVPDFGWVALRRTRRGSEVKRESVALLPTWLSLLGALRETQQPPKERKKQ
jgi:hypothetical protein